MKYSQDKHEIPLKVRTLISSSSTLADGTADGYGPRKLYARAESRGADARSAHPAGPGPDQPARGPTPVRPGHAALARPVQQRAKCRRLSPVMIAGGIQTPQRETLILRT